MALVSTDDGSAVSCLHRSGTSTAAVNGAEVLGHNLYLLYFHGDLDASFPGLELPAYIGIKSKSHQGKRLPRVDYPPLSVPPALFLRVGLAEAREEKAKASPRRSKGSMSR